MSQFLETMLVAAVSTVRTISVLSDGVEPLGGGYERQPIVWAIADQASNRHEIAWSLPRGTYEAVGYHDATGRRVAVRAFAQPVRMTRQGVLRVPAGRLIEELSEES